MNATPVLLPYFAAKIPPSIGQVLAHPADFAPRIVYCYQSQTYARAVASQWQELQTFAIVEHDVLAFANDIYELIDCEYDWCAHGYFYPDRAGSVFGLGCVKFSAELQRQTHDIAADLTRLHWGQIDDYLRRVLGRRGFVQHRHRWVAHLRKGA